MEVVLPKGFMADLKVRRQRHRFPFGLTILAVFATVFWTGCGAAPITNGGTPSGPSPLSITTATLTGGQIAVAYSATLTATGGTTPFTWSLAAGNLPSGLALSPAGVISGTPNASGSFTFTVQARDAANQSATRQLSLTINATTLALATVSLPGSIVGVAYSTTVVASGGTTPYAFTVTAGTLPTGLSLSSIGDITGTPTAVGNFTFTVTVTDAAAQTISRQYSINISPTTLTITTNALPNGNLSVAYSQALVAAGGVTPYTWSLAGGALPAGVTVSAGGVISGTPTASGAFTFVARVQDSSGQSLSRQFSLTIQPPALSITTFSLPNGVNGTAYSQTITTSGGVAPIVFSLAAGALPAGLTLSAGGVISGTPTLTGTSTFTVQATDAANQVVARQYQLQIAATSLALVDMGVPSGIAGSAYTFSFTASGGTLPYTWSITAGTLPANLVMDAAGNITGTPVAAGASTFTVQVSDGSSQTASRQFTLTVNASSLAVNTLSLPDGTVSVAYSQTVTASGGTGTGYTFAIVAGALPGGLALSAGGAITGTPTTVQTSNFTVRVTDSGSNTATQALTININASPLQITTPTLPNGQVGQVYSNTLTASGGTPPLTWGLSSGSLPNGLNLTTAGVLSGTPTVAGNFTFTVQVTDSASQSASRQYTVSLTPANLNMTTATLTDAQFGNAYNMTLVAAGGTPPFTWTVVSGALPNGITLSTAGILSGTPTQAGAFTVTIRVADSGSQNAQRQFTLNVLAPPLQITTSNVPDTLVNIAYNATVTASGGAPPLNWTVSAGTLPPGLTISPGGLLSGTPVTTGTFVFTTQVTDAALQAASRQFTINVTATALILVTTTLPNAQVNAAYTATLTAQGGTPPYTWDIASGSLPNGITLSSSGLVSGTAAASGNSTVTLRVTDAGSQTAQRQFTLAVDPAPLAIINNSLPNGNAGAPYTATAQATGGVTPYTWAVVQGALPPGISLSTGGIFSGTPTQVGQSVITLRVTDSTGALANRDFTINITPVFRITANTVWGGIENKVYGFTVTTADANGGVNFAVTAGSLPTGLSLNNSTGLISGTPTTRGTYTFTVRATDGSGAQSTKTYVTMVSPNDSNYGNVGNPYVDEGGGPAPGATLIGACGSLAANRTYRVTANLNAATAGTICLTLTGPNIIIDLGGSTITGRISLNANGNGTVIFNGRVNCEWASNGGDAGCIRISSSNSFVSQVRLHHITVMNGAVTQPTNTRAVHIDWNSSVTANTVSIKVYNMTSVVFTQTTALRSFNLSIQGVNQFVEAYNNDWTCRADASACQGVMCFGVSDCKFHHNLANMQQNTTGTNARGILFDGNTLNGEAWNNIVTANNNRAIRVRDSFNVRVHENQIKNITAGQEAALHLADPVSGDNDMNGLADLNDFEVVDGTAIFMRSGLNMLVRSNTVSCPGGTCTGQGHFATVRTPTHPGERTIITFEKNSNVITTLPSPQINVDTGAQASVCDSGVAAGLGSIIPVGACP